MSLKVFDIMQARIQDYFQRGHETNDENQASGSFDGVELGPVKCKLVYARLSFPVKGKITLLVTRGKL